MFDPQRDASLFVRFAQDIGSAIMSYLTLVLWPLGEFEQAHRHIDQAMGRASEIGHVGTLAYVHSHVAVFEMMRRNPPGVAPHAEALLDLSRANQLPMFAAYGKSLTASSVVFTSKAAVASGLARKLGIDKKLYAVQNTRGKISKKSMIHNDATPNIEVDPETYEVRADGELLTCPPAEVLPMAQRYFMF